MNKLFSKNIFTFLTGAVLSLGYLISSAPLVSAEIPGKYLAAGLEGSDLLGIVASHPDLFWTALIIFAILCAGYVIYLFTKKKKNEPS